ncbi:MAG: hypothetical protein ABMB14_02275 [Myxococcota bacterium]
MNTTTTGTKTATESRARRVSGRHPLLPTGGAALSDDGLDEDTARAWAAAATAVAAPFGLGPVEQPAPTGAIGQIELRGVEAATRNGDDHVTFEFSAVLPGYRVAYHDGPIEHCASGAPLPVAGGAFLEVRLSPAQAHTEAGQPTLTFTEQALDLGVARELQATCDFEGVVIWMIGLGSKVPFRVTEKANPPRLVVDLHPGT